MASTEPETAADARALLDGIIAAGGLTQESMRRASAARSAACRFEADAQPAALEACRTCPWRRENAESDDPLLADEALVHYWSKIREGAAFACHATLMEDGLISPDAAKRGWKGTPSHARPRECTGALAQVLKEERLRADLGSYEAYVDARGPYGITERGFERLARRRTGQSPPEVRAGLTELDRFGRGWFPDPDGAETAPIVPPCYCRVCTRHGEAHEQVKLTSPSGEVTEVDASLSPLIERMWAAGGVTLASCEWMADAIERLWPAQRDMILRGDSGAPEEMNYRSIVERDLAFVRGIDGPAWEHLVAIVVDSGIEHEVARLGRFVQVAFARTAIHKMVRLW